MPLTRHRVLALVLAGGAGGRMGVLTETKAKPALPFAGTHRLIDFPLSNCANSAISDVWVVQQYEPHALEDHLSNGRPWDLDRTAGGLVMLPPFEGGDGGGWSQGNADALWRHRELIDGFDADVVLVLSADAVYTLDYADVVDAHVDRGASVTMVTTTVPDGDDAGRFGVVVADEDGRVTDFAYKPDQPASDVVTTEVFAYRPEALLDTLTELVDRDGELADFGDALLPRLVAGGDARAWHHRGYWRDVGTPESYWRAHQDLLGSTPAIDLDDPGWPVRTVPSARPPAHIARGASVADSLVSSGCRVDGVVARSVLGPGVRVAAGAEVRDSVLGRDVVVEAGATVTCAVLDTLVQVGAGAMVGAAGDGDLTVLGRGTEVAPS